VGFPLGVFVHRLIAGSDFGRLLRSREDQAEVCRTRQGRTADSANLHGMDASTNGTGFALLLGTFFAFIAVTFGITGVAVLRSILEAPTVLRRVGRGIGAVVALAVFAASACVAGWLYFTAHRGDYAPWASTRIECRTQAAHLGLTGSEKPGYVKACVQRVVDYDTE
jgi:hypothetical protein